MAKKATLDQRESTSGVAVTVADLVGVTDRVGVVVGVTEGVGEAVCDGEAPVLKVAVTDVVGLLVGEVDAV